jgi:uncharacterized repeat protein (TIGR01451 family)
MLAALAPTGPGAARAAAATVRPSATASVPGMPQPPVPLFAEDFENGQGTVPVRLTGYSGASGMTYGADPAWRQNCNGWIAAFIDPPGSNPAVKAQVADCTPRAGGPGGPGATAWNTVRMLAQALGVLNGSANANANHAVSAYTNGPVNSGDPGTGKVEFQTAQPIPVTANGRFLTFSVDAAETSCTTNHNHALLNFLLVNGSGTIPVTSKPIDPCVSGTLIAPAIYAGTFSGDAPALFTGTSVGIKLVNEQGSGNGNDHAFDDIKLLDVTPRLDKSFSPSTAQVGGTSTLTFTITNTSDLLAKAGWSFTDTLPPGLTVATPATAGTTCPAGTVKTADGGSTVSLAGGTLDAGQASCTVTVNVTSARAGTYANDASDITASTGLNPPGRSAVTFSSTPTLDLVKSVSPTWFSAAGQALTYSFLVTNTSTVPLHDIRISDFLPVSSLSCPRPALGPGDSETCTATYMTTATDLGAGSVTNTARAGGADRIGSTIDSDPSTVVVPSLGGTITLVKTATPESFSAAGQLIAFDFLITNTSAVTMSAVMVNDTAQPGLTPVTCPQTTLGPGDSEHCTATYLTTRGDVDAGSVYNAATAQGNPPGSTVPIVSDKSAIIVPAVPQPGITVRKSASPASFDQAGQVIRYRYLVTNTSAVTLTRVHVTDRLPGLSAVACPAMTLAAGRPETCTATYRVTAADLDAGHVTNRAAAAGNPPGSAAPVISPPSTATIRAVQKPAIRMVKAASPRVFSQLGQVIRFTFRVADVGNLTLSHVHIRDRLPGLSAISCPRTRLAARESETCTATYRIGSRDLDARRVTNRATAQGSRPRSHGLVTSPASAVTIHDEIPVTG